MNASVTILIKQRQGFIAAANGCETTCIIIINSYPFVKKCI